MFKNRIRSFTRLFRLRGRRTVKANLSPESADVPRRVSSEPNSHPALSLQPEVVRILPQPTIVTQPLPVPTSAGDPSTTLPLVSPTPVVFIGQTPLQSSPTSIPPLSGNIGPQIYVDGVQLFDSDSPSSPSRASPTVPFAPRHVAFHTPTHAYDPESPISPCSTLVFQDGASVDPVPSPTSPTGHVISDPSDAHTLAVPDAAATATAAADANRPDRSLRHRSLFSPQPVRADVSRFSMPARRAPSSSSPPEAMPQSKTHGGKDSKRESRRESKRVSAMPGSPRYKRQSRWSKEIGKPETQEVLRALSGM